MGSSPSATLFYGYYWQTDEEREAVEAARERTDLGEDWYDWKAELARRAGHPDPWVNYPSDPPKEALAEWRVITRQFGAGVDIGEHCEYDTCHYLYVEASRSHAGDWSGRAVNPAKMVVDPAWRAMLDRWLEAFGLQAPQAEPGWWLLSDYG